MWYLQAPPPSPWSQTCEWVNAADLGVPLNSADCLDSVQVMQEQAGKCTRTSATSPPAFSHIDGEIMSAFRRKTDYWYTSSASSVKRYIWEFSTKTKSSEVSKYFQFRI